MSDPTPSLLLRGDAVLDDLLVRALVDARLVGVLATAEPSSGIHAVPMWFAADDESIVLATGSRSRKVRNVRRHPHATLVVHDSRSGAEICGASIRGRVEIVTGAAALPLVERVHGRYLAPGAEALAPVAEFFASDDVALRLWPEEAFTWDERGSAAARALREAGVALPLVPTAPR